MVKKFLIRFLSTVFNRYFDFYTGGKTRPVFFGIDETSKELRILENNFEKIKHEVENLLTADYQLKKYHEIDVLQHKISAVEDPDRSWKVYMLYMMGDFSQEALKDCPQTCA